MSICGDLLAVLDAETGSVELLRFGSLDTIMGLAFQLHMFDYCADILLQKRRLIRNLSPTGLKQLAALGALPRKLTDFNKVCMFLLSENSF